MPEPTMQKKLVRDLEVGDKLHPPIFDLLEEASPVTITSINPYGTSYHSLVLHGEYEWGGKTHDTGPIVFDKMMELEPLNPDS